MPNRPYFYKDMEKFRKTRSKQRKKYYGKTSKKYPSRHWTLEEERMVLAHDMSDHELSDKIKRSVGAIQQRRSILINGKSK